MQFSNHHHKSSFFHLSPPSIRASKLKEHRKPSPKQKPKSSSTRLNSNHPEKFSIERMETRTKIFSQTVKERDKFSPQTRSLHQNQPEFDQTNPRRRDSISAPLLQEPSQNWTKITLSTQLQNSPPETGHRNSGRLWSRFRFRLTCTARTKKRQICEG